MGIFSGRKLSVNIKLIGESENVLPFFSVALAVSQHDTSDDRIVARWRDDGETLNTVSCCKRFHALSERQICDGLRSTCTNNTEIRTDACRSVDDSARWALSPACRSFHYSYECRPIHASMSVCLSLSVCFSSTIADDNENVVRILLWEITVWLTICFTLRTRLRKWLNSGVFYCRDKMWRGIMMWCWTHDQEVASLTPGSSTST